MIIHEEMRLKPIIESTRIVGNVKNVCDSCEKWGEACETCDVSIPIKCDFKYEKEKIGQMTIVGIPVDYPFEIKE